MKRPLVFAALLASASFAFAEPPPGPPPGMRGPPIEHLTQELGLDATQQAEVKRIFDEQRSKRDAERAQFEASGTRPSREEMKAKHDQNDSELRQQLSGVLTAEQLAKFEAMRKRGPGRTPPGAPPGSQSPAQ